MKRRDVIKGLTLLPLAGGVAFADNEGLNVLPRSLDPVPLPGPLKPGPQIYQSIGVEPIINGRGTLTMIGASVELPEVRKAMEYAALYNVQLDELAMAVGKRLGEITGAEWGMVSSGCAAGLKHVAVGCLTDGNPEKLIRIPNLEGFEKSEVIIPKSQRNYYDHAVRNTGMTVIMPETLEELEQAINPRTALIYMFGYRAPFTTEAVAKIARAKGIPTLLDVAAERLTIPNVHLKAGIDVVAYSGGKIIRGPQCAGLLLGKKDILMAAWQSGSPHHGPGRDNKVGREEHIGMLAAVEAWAVRDHDAEMKQWVGWLNTIGKRVSSINGVTFQVTQPGPEVLNNASPRLAISWDSAKLHITGAELADELANTAPRVGLGGGGRPPQGAPASAPTTMTSISVNGSMLQEDQIKIVGDRIHEVLSRKRSPKEAIAMQPAGTDLTGRWDVTVQFYTGSSKHNFYIEKQNGNYIQGTHKGDFSSRDMAGSIEGNQIKFNSRWAVPGDTIDYTFYGTVNGDTMTGDIHMGEYLMSKFMAKKYTYPDTQVNVVVPKGPPLGN